MVFYVMAMLAAGLTTSSMSRAEPAPCPLGTIAVYVSSTASVQNLTDALACTGEGTFNITWHGSLAIEEIITVTDKKTVTVSGIDLPSSILGAMGDDNIAGAIVRDGTVSGMFSVSDNSSLRLNNMVLEGGNAGNGGAVDVLSSSSLFVFGCTFINNNASNGGAIHASTSEIHVDGDTTFGGNSAVFGGAVHADSSSVFFHGNTDFSSNFVQSRGGMKLKADAGIPKMLLDKPWSQVSFLLPPGAVYAESSSVYIDGDTNFANNSASKRGGAIDAMWSEIGINGNTSFTNNSAGSFGGAVHAQDLVIICLGNIELSSNYAGLQGGVFYVSSSKIGIDGGAIFTNNSAARYGGAIRAVSTEISVDGSAIFARNSVGTDGGAIDASNSEISINGSAIFTSNSAAEYGGAIDAYETEVFITGSAIFTNNTAGDNGGAIFGIYNNFTMTGSKINARDLSGNEGDLYSEAGIDYTSSRSVSFIDNSADGLGGAMFIERADLLEVSDVIFQSNQAALGGAVYISAVEDKQTRFGACVFEGNNAGDGGAVYLYTGPGVDIFDTSVFRNNFARVSGAAIFHTGNMRVFNSTFVANEAGVEGPAVMSIGYLEQLSNVTFSENAYFCRAGEYGHSHIVQNETDFCTLCFDEVCSRCSTGGDGVYNPEEVRIDVLPVCSETPAGSIAPSSGTTVTTLTLEPGYFRTSNQSHDVLKCYEESACRGGNDADKYCASGYTGPYCAVCAEGFAPGIAYSCHECSGGITRSAVGLSVTVGLAVLLFGALVISHLGSAVHDEAADGMDMAQSSWKQICWSCRASAVKIFPLTAIKIVVTVWQIITQFDSIAGGVYPELYKTFVSKLGPINLDLDFVFSYSCLVTNNFYDRLIVATITPLLVLVVLAGSYLIGNFRNRCSESGMWQVRHKHQAAVLYVAFLVYSPVSYRIFKTFGCDKLDDGNTYLRADYSLSCLTSRHSWYKAYALTMVGIYPVGIAAAFAWLPFWHRRDLIKPDRDFVMHLKPLRGLWAPYKPSRYYYEVVECGRRIALTAIAAFVLPNSTAQISIALLFAVVFVFFSEALSPFEKRADIALYRWGNGIVVASMYVAFLMKIDVGKDTTGYLLTFAGVLIAANVFMVVLVLLQTTLLMNEMRRARERIELVDVPVRRNHGVSMEGVDSLNEGGEGSEDDVDIQPGRSMI